MLATPPATPPATTLTVDSSLKPIPPPRPDSPLSPASSSPSTADEHLTASTSVHSAQTDSPAREKSDGQPLAPRQPPDSLPLQSAMGDGLALSESQSTLKGPAAVPAGAGARVSDDDRDSINPLFTLGERVRSEGLDPARVVVQKNGVVLRQGSPGRMQRAQGPAGDAPGSSAEAQAGTGWFQRVYGHAHEHMHPHHGPTPPSAGAAAPTSSDDARPNEHVQEPADGEAQDFRDERDEQDHLDHARMRLQEWRSDFHDRMEDAGLRPPSPWRQRDGASSPSQLDPRLANMLERSPSRESDDQALRHVPSSTLNGSSSFYSAASDAPTESAASLRRSESPVSYITVSDAHTSVASTSHAPHDPLDRAPVAFAPGFVATNSRLVPLPASPRLLSSPPSNTSPSRVSTRSAVPAHEVVSPAPAPADWQQSSSPPRSSSRKSPPSRQRILHGSPERMPPSPLAHSPIASASSQLHPPAAASSSRPRTASPHIRRSNTADSPSLIASPSLAVPGSPSLAVPVTSQPRRSSTTSSHRLSPSPTQRSHSFSNAPAHPSVAAAAPQFAFAGPSSAGLAFGGPTSPQSPMFIDDVDASIAAQADAIRRQRQEKRAEAEKAAAAKQRDRAASPLPGGEARDRERLGVPGSGSGTGGGLGLGSGTMPAGPGALLKRRTTRMGSGSSAVSDGQLSSAGGARTVSGTSAAAVPNPIANAAAAGEGSAEDGAAQLAAATNPSTLATAQGGRQKSRAAGADREDELGAGVLVGNLIGQDHANYVLMYNMLTGIRIGVSRCQAKAKRPLTDADYTARHKFSFDIVGNELTPSVRYDFKFKDYAPWVFRELREYFFLDPSDYLVSLTAKYILSELGSPGKSGSFFYFSRDYRFIIKTIRHAEHKFLRSILKEYHEHIKKNPHTLLSRFYGLHRVKLPHGKKIHFVIFNNLFPPHRDIHETYDLKGSAIGRMYPEEKAAANPHAVLKDLNWVQRHRQLALGPEKKALFEEQLRRDTELLQRLGIMDYSLLTGIHNGIRGNSDGLREDKLSVFQPDTVKVSRKPTQIKRDADASALRKAVQRSDPQALGGKHELPEHDNSERRLFLFYQDEGGMRATGDSNEDLGVIYYLGIIDILTPYTFAKRIEHFFKGLQHNKHMISAVPPREYGDRFLAFIKSSIRGNDESTRPPMFENESHGAGCGPSKSKKGKKKGKASSVAQEKEKAPEVTQEKASPQSGAPVPPPNISADDEKAQQQLQEQHAATINAGPVQAQ
ncbi:1-phosphatidylinositol-4-phosphate 5-kinase [Rhodotorula paludigena]|uniref:1-phosphatidylinositol-4-phosphate 5-kinase n=1 Tax=Rhodotorula paludigena TaxID=86838 RepID=UPI00316BABCF